MSIKISDDYLAGFIDGEGSFYIGVVPSEEAKLGWQVIHFFKVSQNPSGKVILDFLKKKIQGGYVRPNHKASNDDKSLAYVVRDFDTLYNKVIPFLVDTIDIKQKELIKFKKVLELVKAGRHLNINGMKEILDISYSMNTKKRKYHKEFIIQDMKSRIPTDYTPDTAVHQVLL